MELGWALNLCEVLLCEILKVEVLALRLLDLALKGVQTVCQFFDIAATCQFAALWCLRRKHTHPLLGPRFIGCLLNWHLAPVLLQLEQASGPFSLVASQRIYSP